MYLIVIHVMKNSIHHHNIDWGVPARSLFIENLAYETASTAKPPLGVAYVLTICIKTDVGSAPRKMGCYEPWAAPDIQYLLSRTNRKVTPYGLHASTEKPSCYLEHL